jgi:hypothetical protein
MATQPSLPLAFTDPEPFIDDDDADDSGDVGT